MKKPLNKAVFLDRDGTLIYERPGVYISRTSQLRLYKSTPEALRILSKLGFKLFIVSNQSGIGRGYFGKETVEELNAYLRGLLKKSGVLLDGIYYCPHAPEKHCRCRKPETLLGEQIIKEHGVDPAASFMIGDKRADVEFGRRLGMKTILVRTGNGRHHLRKYADQLHPDRVAANILNGAKWIKNEIQN